MGTSSVLYLIDFFFIKFHPQIIASLFAKSIFLLIFVNNIVGSRPAIPGIADTVISIFLMCFSTLEILLRITIFLFLYFFLIFK
jgi:hypothetical protein